VTGKAADAICAAYYAQEAVLRMMKPGTTVSAQNFYFTSLFREHCHFMVANIIFADINILEH
jgi:hypothetical protein